MFVKALSCHLSYVSQFSTLFSLEKHWFSQSKLTVFDFIANLFTDLLKMSTTCPCKRPTNVLQYHSLASKCTMYLSPSRSRLSFSGSVFKRTNKPVQMPMKACCTLLCRPRRKEKTVMVISQQKQSQKLETDEHQTDCCYSAIAGLMSLNQGWVNSESHAVRGTDSKLATSST